MFRVSLLLCLSVLLYGSSSRPYKLWRKGDEALQDTKWLSDKFDEKMTFGLKEVEPPEELDLTQADVDPSMLIWKAVKQQKYNKPEDDKDDLYHSFDAKLTADIKLPDSVQPQFYGQSQLYQEPEEDRDDLYHAEPQKLIEELLQEEEPVITSVEDSEEAKMSDKFMHWSPEEDKDDLYHGHIPSESVLEVMQIFEDKPKGVYTEPEEDRDKYYHGFMPL
ncbi:uncharacterized protein si:ch211-217g15.3 [Hoplias malabaricus]|uniref:uncharacterized protein si:ch211-217g15.3 n=1 Tax=Hoplias malabaricus TaxID=27720 RepID=UPI003461B620